MSGRNFVRKEFCQEGILSGSGLCQEGILSGSGLCQEGEAGSAKEAGSARKRLCREVCSARKGESALELCVMLSSSFGRGGESASGGAKGGMETSQLWSCV